MSSGDFNNLALRNTTSYNPDGSFVSTGYVFTVSTNGRQLWTNNLSLNNLSASTFTLQSTFTVASNIVNTLTVNSTALVSSLSVSGPLSFSTLTGSTLEVASGGSIGSTLTVSTLNGSNGSFASTLTVSTLNGSNGQFNVMTVLGSGSVASTLTVSSLAMTADSYFSSTLYGSTLSSVNGQFQNLIVNGSGVVSSTLSVSTLSTTTMSATTVAATTVSATTVSGTTGQFQSLAVSGSGSVASTLTVSSLQGVSSFVGSTMFSNIITVSTLYVSSVISGMGFGSTGPTGAAGSGGGGGGGGGTGYTGPVGPTGASGQTAVLTMTPSATQTITAVNTAVKWGTTVVAQSTGETGFSYNSGTGLFTNTTADARPLLIEYAVALDVTGNGAVFVGLNGSTAAYGVQHVSANYFSGSATVLVPAGQTVGLYYSDTAPSVVVQTTSMISLTVLAAGSQGPTGAPGGTSAVSVLSATSAGQVIATPSTNTELLWANTDASQSQGVTGLTYSAGRYTNGTQLPLAFQIEYQVSLTTTAGGASFVGINGASSLYGQMYNDNNIFNNSVTILLAPGSYFSVWYADNAATAVSAGSRITITLLVSGMGPTGIQGPVGQVGTLARYPAVDQAISASVDTVVLWDTVEASQTVGSTGLTYTPLTGLFTNTSTASVPILVEYAIGLNTTGNGASYVGLTPFGSSTVTAYGTIVNTTNYFSNSYMVQVAPGASFGIYYRDNSAITVKAAYSRMVATLLVAGQPGAAGPVGTVAAVAATPSTTQTLVANTVTVVAWDANDGGQSIGSTGLSYAGGLYTNTTASTLPLLIEYGLVLNTTGNGSSYVGVTPFGSSTVTAYGITTNLQNIFANSFTIQLGPGATVGIYYVDASAVTIQTTSRLSITLLTAGTQGATGPLGTGPTGAVGATGSQGATGPVGQVAKVSRVADGTQAIVAAATGVAVLFATADSNQSGGNTGFTYSAGLFTNETSSALPVLVEYAIDLTTTQGGFSYVGLNGNVAAFGGAYNDTNSFSSSYTLLVPAGQTVGVYYLDNAATTTVKATSRVSVTVLMAGQQGATGATGASLWQITAGGTGMYYTAGNVGIGTANPLSALDVRGGGYFSGNVGFGMTNPSYPIDAKGSIRIGNASSSTFQIDLGQSGVGGYRSGYLLGDGTNMFLLNQQNGDLQLGTNNTEKMRITAAGNVGIGTANPTAALQVNGNIYMGHGYRNFSLSGGNSFGYLYGAFAKYSDGIHLGYNFYNDNTTNYVANTGGATSRLSLGYGEIAMYTGGTNVEPSTLGYYQNSVGNVGIGTTLPAARLDVRGSMNTTDFIQLFDTAPNPTNGVIRVATAGGVNYFQSGSTLVAGSSADIVFGSIYASYEWMRLAKSGNVGIGSAAPNAPLTITRFYQNGGTHAEATDSAILLNTSIGFGAGLRLRVAENETVNASDLQLTTCDNGGTQVPRMTILGSSNTNGGFVGIGTATPIQKLDVRGNTYISGTIDMGSTITLSGNSTVIRNYTVSYPPDINPIVRTSIESQIYTRDGTYVNIGSRIQMLDLNTNPNYPSDIRGGAISFQTIDVTPQTTGVVPYERMRITPSGYVGIGITNPSYKLHLLGNNAMNATTAGEMIMSGVRYGTIDVQNAVSYGLSLGGTTIGISPYGRLDFMLNGSPGGGNNYGLTPDVTVMSLCGNYNVGIGITGPGAPLHVGATFNVGGWPVLGETTNSAFMISERGSLYGLNMTCESNTGNFSLQAQRFDGTATAYALLLNPSGGNVGIGITNPRSLLQLFPSGATGSPGSNGVLQITCGSTSTNIDGIAIRASVDENHIINFDNTSGVLRGMIAGVNSTSVAYNTSSDRRLKDHIHPIEGALSIIKQLEPVHFRWKPDDEYDFGMIAQEVYKVLPFMRPNLTGYIKDCTCTRQQIVQGILCDHCLSMNDEPVDENGKPRYYGLDYGKFTPYLIGAVKEMNGIIEQQQSTITSLLSTVSSLTSRLDALSPQ